MCMFFYEPIRMRLVIKNIDDDNMRYFVKKKSYFKENW